MNKPYLILFETPEKEEYFDKFLEVIRSTFVSKKGKENSIIISVQENMSTKEIYDYLKAKLDNNISFIIIPFIEFYGRLSTEVWEWLQDTFPHIGYTFDNKSLKFDGNS